MPQKLFELSTVQRAFSVKVIPTVAAPSLDGKDESSSNYAQEAELWRRATNFDVAERASVLV